MTQTALWLSRHDILPEQLKELEARGYAVIYSEEWVRKNFKVRNASELHRMVVDSNPDIVIATIPVSMLSQFLDKCKVPVIQAVMLPLKHLRDKTIYSWTGRWRRVVKAQMIYEDWP
jgi:hypothetical protein